ncbi:hypothetical protein HMPREF9420_1787 [Segatella salivae DSM 15606]|uniref:Uncharacterized protein n=1 Tax=Segatella salivae DSM 15606 TaxID=888832 RepID=E6MQL9_9BACT|nr:hypothetical protein HMPREF9420_1787 [Segatella salivae DSM 15606]
MTALLLANPGLLKEQRLQRCTIITFDMADIFIEVFPYFAIYLFECLY